MKPTVIELWQSGGPIITTHESQDEAHSRYIIGEQWLEINSSNRLIALFEYGVDGDLIECRSRKGEL